MIDIINLALPYFGLIFIGCACRKYKNISPAFNVFVFARHCDRWVEPAPSSILLGTLLSVATLTTVMWMVKTGMMPPLLFR